tara:strand:+ start:292 stop:684 length:393 start_codon:yes stop_codon:yes gene_type:complete
MKKTILAMMITLFAFSASAQLSLMSNVQEPDENVSWGIDNFTNNIGVGYQISDDVMVGVQQNGDNYDLIGRYNISNDLYLSVQMPTENSTDNITYGVGMSIHIWDNFYAEPNYIRKDEEGSINVGLSYKL